MKPAIQPSAARNAIAPRIRLAVVLLAAFAAIPSTASAQTLHVYGPPGDGAHRRVLAVFEAEDGRCASLDGMQLEASDGATVTLGEAAGECARWLEVEGGTNHGQVVLRAVRGNTSSEVSVAMAPAPLDVRAARSGTDLRVTVAGVSELETTRAVAVWAGGGTTLERTRRGEYAAQVPVDALIGIVVSAGERSGAAAIAPRVRSGQPELLLMPSLLSVALGGTPRTAAYLVVADAQARLSRNVPLQITSERGQLRALDWLSPGVATVALAAAVGVHSVDLRVSAGTASARADLPAGAAWPVTASIIAPTAVAYGELAQLTVGATSADHEPVDPTSLVVRCGELAVVPDATGAATCPVSGTTWVIVQALVAGTRVPLAVSSVSAPDAPTPAVVRPRAPSARAPALPAPRPATLRLAALGQFAVDLWALPTIGVGGALRMRLGRAVSADLALRYQLTFVTSKGQGIVSDSLDGLDHAGELTVGARLSPFDGIPLAFFAAGGLAFTATSATVGSANVTLDELHAPVVLGVGTTVKLGAVSLGIDLFARAAVPLHATEWDEPWLRFGLEVSGGVDLAP